MIHHVFTTRELAAPLVCCLSLALLYYRLCQTLPCRLTLLQVLILLLIGWGRRPARLPTRRQAKEDRLRYG
jgi:hypothetical protein